MGGANGATVVFNKVPKNQQLIINTITCYSSTPNFDYGVLIVGKTYLGPSQIRALIPSIEDSREPDTLVVALSGSAIPFAALEQPAVFVGVQDGGTAICTIASSLKTL